MISFDYECKKEIDTMHYRTTRLFVSYITYLDTSVMINKQVAKKNL